MNESISNNNSNRMNESANQLVTIRSAVHMGAELLRSHNIDNADYDSFALLSDINGMDRTYYFIHGNDPVSLEHMQMYRKHLQMRSEHVPLQHIIGKAYFYGYEFQVNSDVLIPRPDTEILVEEVKKVTDQNSTILDMCTGSGCIILTLACEKHLQKGIGIDISEKALTVAKKNKDNLKVDCVDLVQSDLFSVLNQENQYENQLFDVIVSNPPYIRTDVISTLSEEVKNHDPMLALDGFEDGLYFYREITKDAKGFLKSGGWLCYEIGYDQAKDVSEIMRTNGYTDITVIQDLNGLDRVVKARFI